MVWMPSQLERAAVVPPDFGTHRSKERPHSGSSGYDARGFPKAGCKDHRDKPSCSKLSVSSRRSAYTRYAPDACSSWPSNPPVRSATAAAFIRRAARTSYTLSPTTKQSSGSLSSFRAARRKRSGAGFAASTSSAVTTRQSGRFEMWARSRFVCVATPLVATANGIERLLRSLSNSPAAGRGLMRAIIRSKCFW